MRLLEHQSKTLLSRYGLSFTTCRVCTNPADAEQIAGDMNSSSLVVKAQVPLGGRGKAGAVIFAENAGEARAAAERLLAMNLRGHPVRQCQSSQESQLPVSSTSESLGSPAINARLPF